MHDVFISYSHKDAVIADAICHKFEAEGIRCWYAPRNISPGEEWADAIIKALEETKIMILVFTDESNVSTQVHREVDAAIGFEKTIIPFKCSDAVPTGSMKYYLSTLHWLDAMNDPLEKSIQSLLAYVKGALAAGDDSSRIRGTAAAQKPSGSVKSHKKQGILLYGVIGALAVVLVIVGLMNLNKNKAAADLPGNTQISSLVEQQTAAETVTEAASENAAQTASIAVSESQEDPEKEDGANTESEQNTPKGGSADNISKSSYSYDEDLDSPGAEDYLYTVLSTDGHKNGIRLDVYFGQETSVIEIPEIIDGLPVVRIGEKCFSDCDYIEKVILPETMTYIGYRAFYWCENLSEMNFPASLTGWGDWAFTRTAFKNITVPESFESLGAGSLYGCPDLETVVLSEKVTEIKEDTFYGDSALISVTIPGKEVDIETSAFDRNIKITIIGVKGSNTERFAKGMGFLFEEYTN